MPGRGAVDRPVRFAELVAAVSVGVLFIAGGALLHIINLATGGDYAGAGHGLADLPVARRPAAMSVFPESQPTLKG